MVSARLRRLNQEIHPLWVLLLPCLVLYHICLKISIAAGLGLYADASTARIPSMFQPEWKHPVIRGMSAQINVFISGS